MDSRSALCRQVLQGFRNRDRHLAVGTGIETNRDVSDSQMNGAAIALIDCKDARAASLRLSHLSLFRILTPP